MRVLFLLRSLVGHGAERQATLLARGLNQHGHDVTIATFYAGGAFAEAFPPAPGLQLRHLGKQGRWDVAPFLRRLLSLVRERKPHVIYSFGAEPNLAALLIGKITRTKVAWGIRRSNSTRNCSDFLSAAGFELGAILSGSVDKLIYNSARGHQSYSRQGYEPGRAEVIVNGFDTDEFRPRCDSRIAIRKAWGVQEDELLIGIAGRIAPVKNHGLFLAAAAKLAKEMGAVRFVCIGEGPDAYAGRMRTMCAEAGLSQRLVWAGQCKDMASAYAALDFLTLCSLEEGFPNVVGEAMACGTPVVAVDVGDCAALLGDCGVLLPNCGIEELICGWKAVLRLGSKGRLELGLRARSRIQEFFGLDRSVGQTERALRELCAR